MSDVLSGVLDIHLSIRESDPDAKLEGVVFPAMASIDSDPQIYALCERIYKQYRGTKVEDFYVHVPFRDGSIVFRGHQDLTVSGKRVFMLRKTGKELPDLNKELLPESVCRYLTHPFLIRGGLVIICGAVGQGKSTTAAATVSARLRRYGGVCLTMEDPPEYPLDRVIGKGICYQTHVRSSEMADAMKRAMRAFPAKVPGMLFLGEVRDYETASQMLRAATNGLLVILTLHVDSLSSIFARIAGLAAGQGEDQTNLMNHSLASSLKLVLHQDLLNKRFTMLANAPGNHSLRNLIAKGDYRYIPAELERQRIQIQQGIDIFQPPSGANLVVR